MKDLLMDWASKMLPLLNEREDENRNLEAKSSTNGLLTLEKIYTSFKWKYSVFLITLILFIF